MPELAFTIVVRDDGSAVVERFEDNAKASMKGAQVAAKTASSRIARSFRRVRTAAGNITGAFSRVGRAVFSLKGAFAALGVGLVVRSLLQAANVVESARTRLVGLKGSVEEAEKTMRLFEATAAKVPFTLEEIIDGGTRLEAFGAKAEEALVPVADLAAFMGTTVPEAAAGFGRAFAAGAGAADMLRDRGVLALIKLQAGIDDISKLTLPEFRKAMLGAMTDPDGKIAGATARLAKTFAGRMSMMGDAIFKLRASFGRQIIESDKLLAAITGLAGGLNTVATASGGASDSGTALGDVLADLIPTAERVVSIFFSISRAALRAKQVFLGIIGALQAVNVAVAGFFEVATALLAAFLREVANVADALGLDGLAGQARRASESLDTFAGAASEAADQVLDTGVEISKTERQIEELDRQQKALTMSTRAAEKALSAQAATVGAVGEVAAAVGPRLLFVSDAMEFLQRTIPAPEPVEFGLETVEAAQRVEDLLSQVSERGRLRLTEDLLFFVGTEKEKMAALEASVEKQLTLESDRHAAMVSGSLQLFGNLGKIAELGGRRLFALSQAAAIGEAVVNTAVGVTQALRSLPPPLSFAVAASIAALGAAQVATILSARPGAAGGGGVGGAGGVAAAGPAAAPEAPPVAEAQAGGGMQVNISVAGFVGDEAELASQLGRIFREAVGDGVEFGLEASR